MISTIKPAERVRIEYLQKAACGILVNEIGIAQREFVDEHTFAGERSKLIDTHSIWMCGHRSTMYIFRSIAL
jgi:hypothetical protein